MKINKIAKSIGKIGIKPIGFKKGRKGPVSKEICSGNIGGLVQPKIRVNN